MATIKCRFTSVDLKIYDGYELEKEFPNFFPPAVFKPLRDDVETHVRAAVKKLRHPYKDTHIGYLIMYVRGVRDELANQPYIYHYEHLLGVNLVAVDLIGTRLRKIIIEVPHGA